MARPEHALPSPSSSHEVRRDCRFASGAREDMLRLQDPKLSPPTSEFVLEFVVFGTRHRAAVRRRAIVLADKAADARRILKTNYRRTGDVKIVSRKAIEPQQLPLVA